MKRITENAIERIATLIIVAAAVLDAVLLLSGSVAWARPLAIYVAVPVHVLLVLCIGIWWSIREREAIFDLNKQMVSSLRSVHEDEEGAALYEYALVFPLLCLVVAIIVAMGWWWWNQSTAAVAIHDGARDAAAHDGNLGLGYDTTRTILGSHLGRSTAEAYEGHFRLWPDGARRSVRGEVNFDKAMMVPFIGSAQLFEIRASTFQRNWQFYGGPPDYWE